MSMRTYKASVRKIHEAYVVLNAAADGAEYEIRCRIWDAISPMQAAIDALRVRVCRTCGRHGNLPVDSEGWSRTCQHPDVPVYDVRSGDIDEERTARIRGIE
jgi:hypothetical protein